MIGELIARARQFVLPWWARTLAIAALVFAAYGMGRLEEARRGAEAMVEYVAKQAAQTVVIVKRQIEVVTKTETKYRDRVQKIYVQGEQIETLIPEILTPDVDRRLPLPAGFVRILDAAWSGDPVGPTSGTDGEPSTVPPSVVAANETDNATTCKVWRIQALKWREFYAGQQIAVNGKASDWYKPAEQ